MQRRYTLLSVSVSVAVAWVLITPSRPLPPEIPAEVPELPAPQLKMTRDKSLSMAVVTLPPPPAMAMAPETAQVPQSAKAPQSASRQPPLTPLSPHPASPNASPSAAEARAIAPLLPVKSRQRLEPAAQTPVAEPVPAQARPAAPEPRPEPQSDNQISPPDPVAETPPDARQAVAEGRPLLKLLEVGEGPSIEISWPEDRTRQARLYDLFSRCYGMRVALMDARGDLFDSFGAAAQSLHLNTDKYSGFVRQSQGRVSPSEARQIRALRTHHRLPAANPVRLFPRETDAVLLAGLHQVIGPSYRANKTVQARYSISGARVRIVDIRSDGTPVRGSVDLSAALKRNCRSRGMNP